jgi:hypothetical protein
MEDACPREQQVRKGIPDRAESELVDGVPLAEKLDGLEHAAALGFRVVKPGE